MTRRPSTFTKGAHWWGCPNFPVCRITSAEHPDGTLMSTPADEELKMLRKKAHFIAERIWGNWYDMAKDAKEAMYFWLKHNTRTGHIGKMGKAEVLNTIEKLRKIKWTRCMK